jgi:opacity protein-like surface antigen
MFKLRAILSAATGLLIVTTPAWAQHKAEITPFVGYVFGNSVSTRNGKVGLAGDMNYGVLLDVNVRPGGQVELSYARQDTKFTYDQFGGIKRDLTDVAVNYFQIGGLGYVARGQAQPFMSFTLGATWYDPKQNTIDDDEGNAIRIDDEWRFSMQLGLGAKYFASERVGLRVQGRLYATFLDSGGGVFCGFGGCSLGLFGTGVIQGDFSGGVTIAVGG